MKYDTTKKSTQYLVGAIFQKLSPDFLGVNFNPFTFCEHYDEYREKICENLCDADKYCACGYTNNDARDNDVICPICCKRAKHSYSKLAEHIALSETVSDFVELYKEKFYKAD